MNTKLRLSLSGLLLAFGCLRLPLQGAPGDLDPSFGTQGRVTTPLGAAQDRAAGVVVQSDGRIVVAGSSDNEGRYDFSVARYNTDGSLDTRFNSTGKVLASIGTNNTANALAVQVDGKIIVAGFSDASFGVVRFNADGTLDSTFGSGGKVTVTFGETATAFAVAVQGDGKIVLAGDASSLTYFDFALARLNPDGSPDTTFAGTGKLTTDFGSNSGAYALAVQTDGRIVVVGKAFGGGVNDFALARYLPDGTLDTTFGGSGKVLTPIGPNGDIAEAVALQSDGKIVVAGSAEDDAAVPQFAIARYSTSGSLDHTFGGVGFVTTAFRANGDEAKSVAIQTDGRIVVAGLSKTDFGSQDLALARYNVDGSFDRTFKTTGRLLLTGFEGPEYSVALQTDGLIVVAGSRYDVNAMAFDFTVSRFDGGAGVGEVLLGPVVNPANGNLYYLLSQDRWASSQARAQALGGHLATVDDAAENKWIYDTFSHFGGVERALWIGLNDLAQEGTFAWSSGIPVGFTNWNPGEPNNSGAGETFTHMIAKTTLLPADTAGRWNDLGDTNVDFVGAPLCGVVEATPPFIVTNTGADVPDEPTGTVFLDYQAPAIDAGNVGGVGIIRTPSIAKQTVIYGTILGSVLARVGGTAPEGTTFTTLGDPVFGGEAFGFAGKAGDAALGRSGSVNALYSRQSVATGLKLLAREGGDAPGVAGGKFSKLSNFGLPRNRPGLIFAAKLKRGGAITSANDFGVWRETPVGGDSELILRTGSPAPSLARGISARSIRKLTLMTGVPNASDQRRSFAPDGSVMAAATFDDGSNGLVRVAPGGSVDVPLERASAVPELEDAEFVSFGPPAVKSGGGYAVFASLLRRITGKPAQTDQAVFASLNGSLRPILRRFDAIPGNNTQRFTSFGQPLLAQSGYLGLIATLAGRGVTPANNRAIVQHRNGKTNIVTRLGAPASGFLAGAKYTKFSSLIVTDTAQGQMLFTATVAGKGVTVGTNQGLWAVLPSGELKLLLRSGQLVTVGGESLRVRTFQTLSAKPASRGQGRSADADGFVTAKVTLSDGRKGVIRMRQF